ncbi:tetratricopeptide repeat protein [Stigmatella sp. ncwal1]|uniref:Tetratricopeptide repeat protein n=1 Tax=Stigmatella ashevillensis TaxID=2995309 RepID=A0ABT5D537_9BACT|nr:tetratricopeptide repeat protein [Stigmatella ashevillena]MDC0708773.1 tetratricopeptide repeat protein [Stigmatella ashevillena]
MATTRAAGPETSPVDDEFLNLLYRGGELLAAGKMIEAKDYLERAHQMQPKNEKGQNLLGLTYFKLGLFDRAAEIYEMLVRENPVDPTLRVNLGLVYLKTNALQRAVREFEVAVDLSPDHKKAHNYLGLALAQQSEYGRAREHFLLSGSDAMAEKMSRAIAGETFVRETPVPLAPERGFPELERPEPGRGQGGTPSMDASSDELDIDVIEEIPTPQVAAPPPPPPPARPPALIPRQAPPPPPAPEDDWGAQFGLDEVPAQQQTQTLGEFPEIEPEALAPEQPPLELPVLSTEELASPPEPFPEVTEAGAPEASVETARTGGVPQESSWAETLPGSGDERAASPFSEPPPPPSEAEPQVPVMSVEELSEDGMPVLTAEPEDAENLAAMAQHEQAPAPVPPEPEALAEPFAAPDAVAAVAPEPAQDVFMEAEPSLEAPPAEEALPPEPVPAAFAAELPPQAEAYLPQAESYPLQAGPVPTLGELAPLLPLSDAGTVGTFSVSSAGCSVRVEGQLLIRLEGLVAFSGKLTFQPEMKRFRGRATDKSFGEGAGQLVRASGQGALFIEPTERHTFVAMDLGDESAYFRDENVFAFEEPVTFENGRVPSDAAPDLDLVHLRGSGKVLLSLPGPLRLVPVGMQTPVSVQLTHLVGWQGNLTPRVVSLWPGVGSEAFKTAVELSGEGFALICLPVR